MARLRAPPPWRFLSAYQREIAARGAFVRAQRPGARIYSAVSGYRFHFLRGLQARPFTLEYRGFEDWKPSRSDAGLLESLRDYASPFGLEGRDLVVRLGWPEELDWTRVVLAPAADVVDLKELPVRRLPGATLAEDPLAAKAETGWREDGHVRREYFAPGASMRQVLDHYRAAWYEVGFTLAEAGQEGLVWQATTPLRGIRRVEVGTVDGDLIRGSGLDLRTLKETAPALMADYPPGARFSVSVEFAEARESLPYLEDRDAAARLAVVRRGDWKEALGLLSRAGHQPASVALEALGRYALVVLPRGALDGCEQDPALAAGLEAYVERGGRLVVLGQTRGATYRCLPSGQAIEAFGSREDGSDYRDSVYAEAPHPALGWRAPGRFSANVDGYFEGLPQGATIMLRQVRNSQPCLASYRYGEGLVALTTLFDGTGGVTERGRGAPEILDHLLAWALTGGQPPATSAAQAAGEPLIPDLQAWVVMPDGEDVESGSEVRFRYSLRNRSQQPRRLRLYWDDGTPPLHPLPGLTLPSGARHDAEVRITPQAGRRAFWLRVYDADTRDAPVPAQYSRCPGCLAAAGKGFSPR